MSWIRVGMERPGASNVALIPRRVVGSVFVAALITAHLIGGSLTFGQSASGTIDFDFDPNLIVQDDPPFALPPDPTPPNTPVVANVITADSVMELTLSRDNGTERVYLDLGQTFGGNFNNFKARMRFGVTGASGGTGADVLAGFFSAEELNVDDSTTTAVVEPPGTNQSPTRYFGGAYDRRTADLQFNEWYVYEFEFQPEVDGGVEIAILRLYEGDGTTLIDQDLGEIIGGGTSGIVDSPGGISHVGFGNEDGSQLDHTLSLLVDFMTWSVNAPLPSDPTFAPDSLLDVPPGPRTYASGGSNNWNSSSNWTPFDVPDSNLDSAILGPSIGDNSTVYTDEVVTVAGITFDHGFTYAVAGAGRIVLEAASGNASLLVAQGSHQFQAAVELNSNTDADIASGSTLALNNRLILNGNQLTATGGGTLVVNGIVDGDPNDILSLAASSLAGDGEIGASVVAGEGATVSPGNSPGVLTVHGDYQQQAGATLAIEIGGLERGTDYDALVVGGAASLDGTLAVQILDGFQPAAGDVFDILDFAAVDGHFASLDLPNVAGLKWDTSNLATSGAIALAAVPEPTTLALLCVVVCLTLAAQRRPVPRRAYATVAVSNRSRPRDRRAIWCCSLSSLIVFACAGELAAQPNPFSDSGTFDFDTDPNFDVLDSGAPAFNHSVRTSDSVLELTMTRASSLERLSLPITAFPANKEDTYRVRLRFGVVSANGSGGDVLAGFFSSAENGHAGAGSTTAAVIEAPTAGNSPARFMGGAYDRKDINIPEKTWHIYDLEFRADPEIASFDLLDGSGNFIEEADRPNGGTSGIDKTIDLIGFGNEERSDSTDSLSVLIDWMTWSVNEPLPANPANALDSVFDAVNPIRTWNLNLAGDWENDANWQPLAAPVDNTTTALFGSAIGQGRTILVSTDVTVGNMEFDNTNQYAVAGLGSLTLSSDTAASTVLVKQGGHELQVETFTLANATEVNVEAGATLDVFSEFNLGGNTLTKTGAGALGIHHTPNTGAGAVVVDGGVLGGEGTVGGDLTNNATVAPGASPGTLAVEDNYVQNSSGTLAIEIAGTSSGMFDVLNVGGTAELDGLLDISLLGFAPAASDSFTVLTATSIDVADLSLSGQSAGFDFSVVGGTDLVLTFDSPGTPGDHDGDGNVTGNDLLVWQRGMSQDPFSPGDLAAWQENYGTVSSQASGSAVPEPGSLALLTLAVLGLAGAKARGKRSTLR